jgi:hypothetical protein
MARTKQSGRKSTGGIAPRKNLERAAKDKRTQSSKKSTPKVLRNLLSVRQKSRPRITPVSTDDEMDVSPSVSPEPEPSRIENVPVLNNQHNDPDVRLIFLLLILRLIYNFLSGVTRVSTGAISSSATVAHVPCVRLRVSNSQMAGRR